MNNLKGNGWFLCPSKTLPGKFYYFNGLTGETAWAHGDASEQIKTMKKYGGIQRGLGSYHHPEPSSPPAPNKTDSINSQLNSSCFKPYPTQAFNRSVFPMPVKLETESKVLWTTNETKKPIVFSPVTRVQSNQYETSNIDEIWLQSEVNSVKPWELNKELLVQTNKQPLCQRFVNFEKPVLIFNEDNKIENKQQFDKFYTSTPVNKFKLPSSPTFNTIASNSELFQLKNNNIISYLEPSITKQRHLIKEPALNINVPPKTMEKVFSNHTMDLKKVAFDHCNKVNFGMKADFSRKKIHKINGNDLRMLLLAKKRKSLGVKTNAEEPECKKIRTTNEETSLTKKRVTYNLEPDYSCIENEHVDENTNFNDKYVATSQLLKDLAAPGMRKDCWCIVVDAEVLLEEFAFLDKFVLIDPLCRLLVPSSVFFEISAVSKGICSDRSRVTLARNVIRRLVNSHIIVKTSDDEGTSSPASDAILECCVKTMDQNIHLILISNNEELLTTAKWYAIHCHRISDIKNGLAPTTKLALGLQQMKISIPNDTPSKNKQNYVEHNFGRISFEESEELNDKEKEIIRKYRQRERNPNDRTNEYSMNEYKNSTISNEKSTKIDNLMKNRILNTASYTTKNNSNISNENSRITGKKSMMINTNENANSNIDEIMNLMTINVDSEISNYYSKFLNKNTRNNTSLTSIPKFSIANPIANSMENSKIFNANSEALTASQICNANSEALTASKICNANSEAITTWRCPSSDITDTTILADMQKLSHQQNPVQHQYKIPKKVRTTFPENQNTNEIVSCYFQNPTPKYDLSKFQRSNIVTQTISFEKSRENHRSMFDDNQKPYEIAKENIIFQSPEPIFELNNIEEPLTSVCKIGKEQSKMDGRSFKIDNGNEPQGIQSVNVIEKTNEILDLSRFCVGSNVMKNRLEKRFDEWTCRFKQYMEETLSGVLKKNSPSVLKSMAPPWSLYEALQCIKVVYKKHMFIRNSVDQLCGYLYNTNCRNDNFKKNINLNDFMKAIGCGIYLIKYLKNILQHPADIFDGEECLVKMLNEIEDPCSDPIEPLIRPPAVVSNVEDIEVRRNFIKTRAEIMDYLRNCETNGVATEDVDEIATKNDDDIPAINTESDLIEMPHINSSTSSTNNVDNNATFKEIEKTDKKQSQIQDSKTPFETILKNLPKITKTIENKRVDARELGKCKNEPKPKTKITFDNVKTKENRQNTLFINKTQPNKLKIDSKMLAVKITVPNDKQVCIQNEKGVCNRTDAMNKLQDKEIESTNLKPIEIQKGVVNPKIIEIDSKKYQGNESENEYNKVEINNNKPVERNGIKNDAPVNDIKICKVDITVVKSMSSNLDDYLKNIHGLLDGGIKEFQNGQLHNDAKKICKLKALKANIMITKMIIMLQKLTKKGMASGGQNIEVSREKCVSKTINAVDECLDKAQMLQKTLNRILSVTSHDGSSEPTTDELKSSKLSYSIHNTIV